MLSWMHLIGFTQFNQSSEMQDQLGYSYILTVIIMVTINLAILLQVSCKEVQQIRRLRPELVSSKEYISSYGRLRYFRYLVTSYEDRRKLYKIV